MKSRLKRENEHRRKKIVLNWVHLKKANRLLKERLNLGVLGKKKGSLNNRGTSYDHVRRSKKPLHLSKISNKRREGDRGCLVRRRRHGGFLSAIQPSNQSSRKCSQNLQ